jgi:hypothetical protein
MSDIGVHTLRHSAAVTWLESKVHIKAVADLLGHSSIAITGDIYGRTSDDTARAAVEGLADQLGLEDLAAVAIRVAIHTPRGYIKEDPRLRQDGFHLRVLWSG